MIPILKEPVWHELSNCLEKFPISMTAKQLEEYLLKLKIIKDLSDLSSNIYNRNIQTENRYDRYTDLDYYVPFISDICIKIIGEYIYKEIDLVHMYEGNELGLYTDEEIQKNKSENKLL